MPAAPTHVHTEPALSLTLPLSLAAGCALFCRQGTSEWICRDGECVCEWTHTLTSGCVSMSAKKSSRSLSKCPFQWADVKFSMSFATRLVELI